MFGERQAEIYAGFLKQSIQLIVQDASRPSSYDRSHLSPGLRSLHLSVAARSTRRASHQIFYRVGVAEGVDRIEIVRVLHQAMNPAAHLEAGLRDLPSD